MMKSPQKILIIRFSSIGDIVLTSPVVRCLKEQSGATIHFVTKKKFAGICESNPYIDKVISFESDLDKLIADLKKENYDYIIDLHNNLRSLRLSMSLGKKTFRFRKLNIQKWMLVRLKINRLPEVHIVDRYFEAVRSLGIVNDEKGLDFFIPAKDEVSLSDLPPSFSVGYLSFVCGGTYFTKNIPEEKIIAIGKKVSMPVLLLGGMEDKEKGDRITHALGDKAFNVCGKYTLNQSASLILKSERILSPDTGLMHIAAALGKSVVSLWGNTVPGFGMYPYFGKKQEGTESFIMEIKGLDCRPCSKLGYSKCPKGHFKCMLQQDENAISGLLQRKI
jgi:ADP-heptose:LPS heptosyltransferase